MTIPHSPITPQLILPLGDGFQMVRVHTGGVAAQVVKIKADGDWADIHLVGETVCSSSSEPPVSGCAPSVLPHEAGGGKAAISFFPEMITPFKARLQSCPVAVQKSVGLSATHVRELAAPAFTEFRRLFSHVGLLHRLTLGERRVLRRSPHSIGRRSS